MSRILLDTSALSAFFHGHDAVAETIRRATRIAVTPVTLGELKTGFLGGSRPDQNRDVLRRFLAKPLVRTVLIGPETADRYAQISDFLRRAGTPIPVNDLWIAASAMQFGLRVVTTDRHFERVPQITVELHDS